METPQGDIAHTANDRFKRAYASWGYGGLIVAVVLHFGLFMLVRPFQAAGLDRRADAATVVELPPDLEIPPPPEEIARPATPLVAEVELDPEDTIPPTDWPSNPVESLPPPPDAGGRADRPAFLPYDTGPELRNGTEIRRLLGRLYPPSLRGGGIGGTVVLWIYVNEEGRVERSVVQESSGHAALDEAARQVAARMIFTPAMNRDRRTDVWVSQTIRFEVR